VTDPESARLVSATVAISGGPLDPGSEVLSATTAGTNVTASYDSDTGVLSLTGADTLAHYQQVLQSVTYADTAAAAATLGNRVLDFTVADTMSPSASVSGAVAVVAASPGDAKSSGHAAGPMQAGPASPAAGAKADPGPAPSGAALGPAKAVLGWAADNQGRPLQSTGSFGLSAGNAVANTGAIGDVARKTTAAVTAAALRSLTARPVISAKVAWLYDDFEPDAQSAVTSPCDEQLTPDIGALGNGDWVVAGRPGHRAR
jgi:hypothetical protein